MIGFVSLVALTAPRDEQSSSSPVLGEGGITRVLGVLAWRLLLFTVPTAVFLGLVTAFLLVLAP